MTETFNLVGTFWVNRFKERFVKIYYFILCFITISYFFITDYNLTNLACVPLNCSIYWRCLFCTFSPPVARIIRKSRFYFDTCYKLLNIVGCEKLSRRLWRNPENFSFNIAPLATKHSPASNILKLLSNDLKNISLKPAFFYQILWSVSTFIETKMLKVR